MLSFSHTIISLPIAFLAEDPILIFVLAFALHLVLDALPHWNIYPQNFPRFPYGLVAIDVIGGIVAAYLLIGNQLATIPALAAIAGGNMPDILHSLWIIAGGEQKPSKFPAWVNVFFNFHHNLQRETKRPAPGLISQVIGGSIAIATLYFVA